MGRLVRVLQILCVITFSLFLSFVRIPSTNKWYYSITTKTNTDLIRRQESAIDFDFKY